MFGLSQEFLTGMFTYHPDGYLVRNKNGKVVQPKLHKGCRYARVFIKDKPYPVHRIIFFMHHGHCPPVVDHIDNNPLNNKIENLREATCQQNAFNKKKDSTSKSPYKGVYVRTSGTGVARYEVYVSLNKQRKFFGCFADIEEARLRAIEVRQLHHGQFARHA